MGQRGEPRPSILKRLIVLTLLVVLIGAIVSYFAVPSVRERVDGLVDDAQVAFVLFQHPSGNALDRDATSFWLADPSAGTPTVSVNFGEPTDLAGFTFTGGLPGAEFANYARPRQVEFVYPGERSETFELQDDPAPQEICLPRNHSVLSFDIRILDTYPPAPGGQELVATRQIAFISGSC